jgi:fibronectin-binding autotransporter adhesin
LESLEERTVPSTVTWISTSSGDWADGSNWSSGSQPGAGDDVVIDQPGVTVTHSSGNDSVHSLTNSADLLVAGGSIGFATTCTNDGLIELSGKSGFITALGGGTLVNAADGTIHTLVGDGGSRTINSQLDNEGTISVDGPLDVNVGPNYADVNNGTITVSGGDASFGGFDSTSKFTNAGTMFIDANRTLSIGINDMQFSEADGGSVTGTGTLHLNRTAATFSGDFNTNGVNLFFENAMTYKSSGTLTISADSTLTLFREPTVNAAVENAGTIVAKGSPSITGAFTSDAGSTVQVLGNFWTFGSTLKLTGDFTNHGLIQLSSIDGAYNSALVVSGGTLTNGTDGTVEALAGTGGSRSITGNLINQGTVSLHTNTLSLIGGDFTQTADGTLSIEIGSASSFGQLSVGNSATLDGTLSVALINGYTPTSGTSFKALTFPPGSLTGTFATQDDGGVFTASYNNADVTLVAN